jgi:hypothetical protein
MPLHTALSTTPRQVLSLNDEEEASSDEDPMMLDRDEKATAPAREGTVSVVIEKSKPKKDGEDVKKKKKEKKEKQKKEEVEEDDEEAAPEKAASTNEPPLTEAELKEQERKRKNKERSRLYRLKKRADAEAAKTATAADPMEIDATPAPVVGTPSPQKTKKDMKFTIPPKRKRQEGDGVGDKGPEEKAKAAEEPPKKRAKKDKETPAKTPKAVSELVPELVRPFIGVSSVLSQEGTDLVIRGDDFFISLTRLYSEDDAFKTTLAKNASMLAEIRDASQSGDIRAWASRSEAYRNLLATLIDVGAGFMQDFNRLTEEEVKAITNSTSGQSVAPVVSLGADLDDLFDDTMDVATPAAAPVASLDVKEFSAVSPMTKFKEVLLPLIVKRLSQPRASAVHTLFEKMRSLDKAKMNNKALRFFIAKYEVVPASSDADTQTQWIASLVACFRWFFAGIAFPAK